MNSETHPEAHDPAQADAYWKVDLRPMSILMTIWFLVSLGAGILLHSQAMANTTPNEEPGAYTRVPAPIAHILRAQIPAGEGQDVGRDAFLTANRFKQIRSPSFFIVGRDVSTAEGEGLVQISLFDDEDRFREYFYDPIHLAIDRAGEERRRSAPAEPSRRWESFDILGPYSQAAADRLLAVYTERSARFASHDDRPTEQPVPDRPEDQSWGLGNRLFWIVERPDPSDPLSRSAAEALDVLVDSKLCIVLVDGIEVRKNPGDPRRHSTILSFANPEDLSAAIALPVMAQAAQNGAFDPQRFHAFFAIDPDDSALASNLEGLLRTGLVGTLQR